MQQAERMYFQYLEITDISMRRKLLKTEGGNTALGEIPRREDNIKEPAFIDKMFADHLRDDFDHLFGNIDILEDSDADIINVDDEEDEESSDEDVALVKRVKHPPVRGFSVSARDELLLQAKQREAERMGGNSKNFRFCLW